MVFDFETEHLKILQAVKSVDPLLIGFSLIFRRISPGSAH